MIQLYLFTALVVFSPLPIGGNNPMAWSIFAFLAGILALWFSARGLVFRQGIAIPFERIWFPVVLFAGVCIWAFIQTLSIMPEGWHHPLWRVAAGALGNEVSGAISVNPYASVTALLRLMTYGAVFWMALQLGRDRRQADIILQSIAFTITAYALYGLVLWSIGSETILWYPKWAYLKNLTSVFVNRNSFATYAGMGCVVLLVLLGRKMGGLLHKRSGEHTSHYISRFVNVLSRKAGLYLVALMVVLGALFLTSSRAGVSATLFALVVVIAFGLFKGRGGLIGIIVVVAVALGIIVFLFDLGGTGLAERLANHDLASSPRSMVFRRTIQAIADSPWLGVGYGAFRDVFPMYRNATISPWGVWDMAHNTYLENMLELGIPAAMALFLAIGSLVWLCFKGALRRRRSEHFPLIGFAVSVLVTVHSMVDFSLQIPGVAITYAALLGLGAAQSWSSRTH